MSKHMTLTERALIEKFLAFGFSFSAIAEKLNRSPSTISQEVKKYRLFTTRTNSHSENGCAHYFDCTRNAVCGSKVHGCFVPCKKCHDHDCTLICKSYIPINCKNSKSLHMCVPAAKNNNPVSNTMRIILRDVLHPKSEQQTKSPCLKPIRQGELYFIIYDCDRYSH